MTRGRRNPLCHDFSSRLRQARRESGLARAQLSKAAGLAADTVRALESTKRMPRLNTVLSLAATLEVSAAWLAYKLGPKEDAPQAVASSFQERLLRARRERGLTQARLGELAGTQGAAISAMERDGNFPDIAKVEKIASALGVTPSWLAFGIDEETGFGAEIS